MILAAGYGTRLRPLTGHLPKPLLPVLGRPVIWYQAKLLAAAGVVDAVVNLHHLPDKIEAYHATGALDFLSIRFVREEGRILGTGGGIANAGGFLGGATSIVVNGDTLLSADLGALVAHHRRAGALATLLLTEDPDAPDEHAVFIDREGRVRRMVGIGASPEGLLRCAFMGAHVLEPGMFGYLPAEGCVIRQGYVKAMDDGKAIAGMTARAGAKDVGTPAALLAANVAVLAGSLVLPHAGESLSENELEPWRNRLDRVVEPVFVAPGCSIADGARLGPNAVLSRGARIGRNAAISHSLVLPDEKIKPGETLKNVVAGFGLRIGVRPIRPSSLRSAPPAGRTRALSTRIA